MKIGLIALAAGGYLLLQGKNAASKLIEGLSFDPVNFSLSSGGVNLLNTRYTITLRIFNKSGLSVPVNNVSGGVYSIAVGQPVLLANFAIQKRFDVPANGSIDVPLEMTASNLETLKLIWNIIITGSTPKIQVSGKAYGPFGSFAPIDVFFNDIKLFKVK